MERDDMNRRGDRPERATRRGEGDDMGAGGRCRRGTIRVWRACDGDMVGQPAMAQAFMVQAQAERALRRERRRAQTGCDYDPARHLALARRLRATHKTGERGLPAP